MKLYVFFLSFVLAFLPSLSYAFAPIAIAGSVAGRVAVQTGTGAVIKKMSPTAKQGLIKNAIALCKANVLAMKACSDIIEDMLGDDIHVENKTTVNNDIDVEIYRKITSDECRVSTRYQVRHDSIQGPYSAYGSDLDSIRPGIHASLSAITKSGMKRYDAPDTPKMLQEYQDFLSRNKFTKSQDWKNYKSASEFYVYDFFLGETSWERNHGYGVYVDYRVDCYKPNDKDYLSDDEIEDYFNKRADGDDITNIYNYNYSKHDNITVNNKTESGDTINNYKNDFDKNEAEKNVSANATEKMKNKRKGYDIDDINDENCDKNEAGEYDKCGDDRGKKDGDDEEEPKKDDEEKKDDEKKEDEEEDLISCKTSDFHKKICKFIDDMDEFLDESDDSNTQLKKSDDEPRPTSTKISFGGGCPSNTVINFSYLGFSHTFVLFDSVRFCEFLDDFVKPSVVVISALWGVRILRSET